MIIICFFQFFFHKVHNCSLFYLSNALETNPHDKMYLNKGSFIKSGDISMFDISKSNFFRLKNENTEVANNRI